MPTLPSNELFGQRHERGLINWRILFPNMLSNNLMQHEENDLLSILKQFDRPGPRYTSYPTAPIFSPAYGASEYSSDIERSNHTS
ncbi:MAG: hypothetical protein WAV76_06965 [Bacteroidota bacterium]